MCMHGSIPVRGCEGPPPVPLPAPGPGQGYYGLFLNQSNIFSLPGQKSAIGQGADPPHTHDLD